MAMSKTHRHDHGSGLADSPSRLRFTAFTTTAARLNRYAFDPYSMLTLSLA